MAEAVNDTFKAELVKLHGPWRTRQQLEIAIIEWIDRYNATRLHGQIADLAPFAYEAHWYRRNTSPHGREPLTRTAIKPGVPQKARPVEKPCAASSATSRESSTPTSSPHCLDGHRSITVARLIGGTWPYIHHAAGRLPGNPMLRGNMVTQPSS